MLKKGACTEKERHNLRRSGFLEPRKETEELAARMERVFAY